MSKTLDVNSCLSLGDLGKLLNSLNLCTGKKVLFLKDAMKIEMIMFNTVPDTH